MKRLLLIPLLALSACTLPNISLLPATGLPQAPAPLAATAIDDAALRTAWQSFDVALDGIAVLREHGVLKPGSAKAIAVANGIDRVTAGLTAAEHAATAGSTTSYVAALYEARLAITDLRSALRSN